MASEKALSEEFFFWPRLDDGSYSDGWKTKHKKKAHRTRGRQIERSTACGRTHHHPNRRTKEVRHLKQRLVRRRSIKKSELSVRRYDANNTTRENSTHLLLHPAHTTQQTHTNTRMPSTSAVLATTVRPIDAPAHANKQNRPNTHTPSLWVIFATGGTKEARVLLQRRHRLHHPRSKQLLQPPPSVVRDPNRGDLSENAFQLGRDAGRVLGEHTIEYGCGGSRLYTDKAWEDRDRHIVVSMSYVAVVVLVLLLSLLDEVWASRCRFNASVWCR